MTARSVSLLVIAAVTFCAGDAFAQQKLGDFVTDGGYDWVIGRWVAEMDEGKVEMEYKWGLDKSIVLTDLKMGDFRLQGLIMLDPDRGEVVETAADNRGGTWKGAWTEESGDLVYSVEHTAADGQVQKADVIHSKVDNDSITIAMYGVEGGTRSSEPWGKLTYKRQPATAAVGVASAEQGRPSGDYQSLGDLVSEGGYEWMIGQWLATDGDQKYQLEHKWTLDKHAVIVELKMGDFGYRGLIMYRPAREEIIQEGADSMGGIWKGTWAQGDEGATHRIEYTGADGTQRRMEHVYLKVDNDTFQVKEYGVSDGSRSSEPRRTLTFKRQKAAAESK